MPPMSQLLTALSDILDINLRIRKKRTCAMKRRFVRQNREIARVNSTQSIRIRTLESEISRLLSENIALREEVIRLQFEVDKNGGLGSITTVKGRLEAKLLELGGLVQELGNVRQSAEDRRALRRKSGTKGSPKASPDQRNWKNGITISEYAGGVEGRLPPIVEGKYYPRRTLDAEELGGLITASGDAADSPDLGPPPVAHFDAGDPIKFNANQCEPQMQGKMEKESDLNPALFANLETRRKRRGSTQRGEPTRNGTSDMQSSQEEASAEHITPGHALKYGAKRKFTAREEEEQVDDATAPEADEFQYNGNPTVTQPAVGSRAKSASGKPEKQAVQKSSEDYTTQTGRSQGKPKINTVSTQNGRNVLAPKSVNTDPVSSPVKPKRIAEGEKNTRPNHDMVSKPRERNKKDQLPSQRFARAVQPSEPVTLEPKAALQGVSAHSRLAPQTPAPPPLDNLSPDEFEPQTARPESRDTPPPEDLKPETATTNSFGSIGRSSRRQRGSVSYAEPSLRDKMRRPTKELVDAVAAEERLQQRKNIKAEAEREDIEPVVMREAPSKMRTVTIKKEPTDDDVPNWKAVQSKRIESDQGRIRGGATSPLGNTATSVKADLPASVVTERRRRPSILDREPQGNENRAHDIGAGSTIAALISSKPRSKSQSRDFSKPDEIPTPTAQDFPESSPADPTVEAKEVKPAPARSSRRHSSISDDRVKDALARRAERRKEGEHVRPARSSAALGAEAAPGEAGRGERAASRRRSMML
ncbi:MAG: hypothetical protein Q9169_002402 [Polycauliona sp. 2 TL-2023]